MEQLWSNSQDGEQLWKACFEGHVEIVKLLSSDQRVDINQVNKNGQTPFSTACEKGHIEIVKYLLACGREIDINKKDKYGKTALDIARERSQVFDCQVLDSVFARVRNSNGNVATRMVVTVGHVQGLHFYCGRRADYRCYQCDGLCGPSNGCNCSACRELDNIFLQVKNSNGDVATRMLVRSGHGQGLRFYCGKRGDYKCSTCDGICGPTNGCNCSSCQKLDEIFPQAKNSNGSIALRNFDAWHGYGPRFYCGKRGDYNCSSCDGICGPTNGCNCSSCQKLDKAFPKGKTDLLELIESFQRNQNETRIKLRKELGLPDKKAEEEKRKLEEEKRKLEEEKKRIEEEKKKLKQEKKKKDEPKKYEIEYNHNLFKLKTSSTTLSEFENDIRLKLKLQENIEMVMHYKENEKLYVLDDMEDLEEGMTIQVSASNAPTGATQLQQTSKKIEGIFNVISNLKISSPPSSPSPSKPSVFLTHTWVKDELNRENHSRVATVNKLLKAQGFQTWFDEDKMVGHIDNMMAKGIDESDIILVFITKIYMEKVASEGHDNCKGEFTYATNKNKKMIPIVMEPCMRYTKEWNGPVGIRLGGDLYVDMSKDDSEYDLKDLINKLEKKGK